MRRSYDTIALFYDRLAKLVYGRALINARSYLLKEIPARASILIAGGGTGWELEEISKIYPSGLTITYVDASEKMTQLAAKRNIAGNKVTFITAAIETMVIAETFDIILTPFLFDNFSDKSLRDIFPLLDKHLHPGGSWLYCDFMNTNVFWQKALLKSMYLFFRTFCGIEATKLPDAEACFAKYNYKATAQKFFLHKFITAIAYKK